MPPSLQIKLDNPCQESWSAMKKVVHGRYCDQCCKTVVDFSNMSDREILDYISRSASSNICGRVDGSQLNRNLREGVPRRRFSIAYLWQMLVAGLLIATDAKAQGEVQITEQHGVKGKPGDKLPKITFPLSTMCTGTVINEATGEPVPFASITVAGVETGVAADPFGYFELPVEGSVTLQVSAIGFATKEVAVAPGDSGPLEIFLSPDAKLLDGVVVTLNGYVRCGWLGGISVVSKVSTFEKFERSFLRDNSVRVFPNPAPRGRRINVSLQLKEAGEYRLELMDAGGRLVWWRTVQLNTPQQTLGIDSNSGWSAGVYWLRVSGRHTKKIFHGKVVLQ